jgi:hypothetical protein
MQKRSRSAVAVHHHRKSACGGAGREGGRYDLVAKLETKMSSANMHPNAAAPPPPVFAEVWVEPGSL